MLLCDVPRMRCNTRRLARFSYESYFRLGGFCETQPCRVFYLYLGLDLRGGCRV